jgi:hypothetical protein
LRLFENQNDDFTKSSPAKAGAYLRVIRNDKAAAQTPQVNFGRDYRNL